MIQVNKGDNQKGSHKGKIEKSFHGKPVSGEDRQGKKPCGAFDQGVSERDSGAAMAALAPQQQIAQNGDVVVKGDHGPAGGTHGTGPDKRKSAREAMDTNI
jgi:hypothetical protein